MEILISESTQIDVNGVVTTGYNVMFVNRNKKRSINDSDFFPNGSEIETKIGQLKKLIKTYFDAQV
jgi:hypothetical protein